MASKFLRNESIAASILIAIFAGALMPHALFVSMNRASLVWIISSTCAGLALGSGNRPTKRYFAAALLPTAGMALAHVFYLVTRVLLNLGKDKKASIAIPWSSDTHLDLIDPTNRVITVALLILYSVATYAVILVAGFSCRPVVSSLAATYRWGPEGIERARKTIMAAAALVAAIAGLWAVLWR